jgi:hypothetical protein
LPVNLPALRDWPGYLEYRRELEYRRQIDDSARRGDDYFATDEADRVNIYDPGNGPLLFCRTYPLVLRNKEWSAVIALFVPSKPLKEYVDALAGGYQFAFSEAEVRSEMEFYDVPTAEVDTLIEGMRHAGKVLWSDSHGRSKRFFQIQPSGQIWSGDLSQFRSELGSDFSPVGPLAGHCGLSREPEVPTAWW